VCLREATRGERARAVHFKLQGGRHTELCSVTCQLYGNTRVYMSIVYTRRTTVDSSRHNFKF